MIIAYHKTRKKFYVVKSKKKEDRKFLFSNKDINECRSYCDSAGVPYTLARSAVAASSGPTTDPTPRDTTQLCTYPVRGTPDSDTSDEREEDNG